MSTQLYKEIKNSKKPFERHVTVYDINEYFVIPWTRSSGCGIALLMNPEGLSAALMLSHAWGEDVEQLLAAVKGHCDNESIQDDTAIWFCTFAQYQPEDGAGPSIAEQIQLDPFTRVINAAKHGMVAIHTSTVDLYDRLWCVREVDEALSKKVPLKAAISGKLEKEIEERYMSVFKAGGSSVDALEAAGIQVHTTRAQCHPKDKDMLLQQLFARDGGFKRIDQDVTEFRRAAVIDAIVEAARKTVASPDTNHGQALRALSTLSVEGNAKARDVLHGFLSQGWLETLAGQGSDGAYETLATLIGQGDDKALGAIRALAGQGNKEAVGVLRALAGRGNKGAVDVLRTLAGQGNKEAFGVLVDLVDEGTKEIADALIILAHEGNEEVVDVLRRLAAKGNGEAVEALKTLADEGNEKAFGMLVTLAEQRNKEAVGALHGLAVRGNKGAFSTLLHLANQGDTQACLVLADWGRSDTLAAGGNRVPVDVLRILIHEGKVEALALLFDMATNGQMDAEEVVEALEHANNLRAGEHAPGAWTSPNQNLQEIVSALLGLAGRGNNEALDLLVDMAKGCLVRAMK